MAIRVEHTIDAPRQVVWDRLADLSAHTKWMKDAVDLEFITTTTRGVGTQMRVPTKVGPFRTEDVLEITEWEEGRRMAVQHRGVVAGTGEFRLEGNSPTTIIWAEDLSFPWWMGAKLGEILAAPILRWVWKGNLSRFADLVGQA